MELRSGGLELKKRSGRLYPRISTAKRYKIRKSEDNSDRKPKRSTK
ncbi:hypothetical protein [Paenibacillus sp. FSL P4-0184]